jgi:hypothetical protein
MILEYLDLKSLSRLSQCCWHFKQLADQDRFWKALYFKVHQNKITLVPSFTRWNFRSKAKEFVKQHFDEEYNKKKIEKTIEDKVELTDLKILYKEKVVRFPETVVAKMIPKGRRWKYMF